MSIRESDFRNFLATLPDATQRLAVPKRITDLQRPVSTMGPAQVGNLPLPSGSAQELNPQRGLTPADIANAAIPLRSAGQAGYNTAAALDRGDVGGAAKTAASVLPMMLPGSVADRFLGGAGERAAAALIGHESAAPLMSEADILYQRKLDAARAARPTTSDPALFQPAAPRTDPYVRPGVEDMAIGPNTKPGVIPREQRGPYSHADTIEGLMQSGPIFSKEEAIAARKRAGMVADSVATRSLPRPSVSAPAPGGPGRVYHGTSHAFSEFDGSYNDPNAKYGPGFYFTEDPSKANGYAATKGGGGAPNVKVAGLKVNRPFDINAIHDLDSDDVDHILGTAERVAPDKDWTYGRDLLQQREQTHNLSGGDIYHVLSKMTDANGVAAKRAAANNILREAGYDGITHVGGKGADDAHRVWIAFDKSQIGAPRMGFSDHINAFNKSRGF